MGALSILFAMLRTPIGGAIATALALVAALAWGAAHERRIGREQERARIENSNREAGRETDNAIRDVRRCIDAGGMWSVRAGLCDLSGLPQPRR